MSVQCARNLFAVRDSTYCPCRAEVVVIAPWFDISREGHEQIRIAPFKRIQSDRKGEAVDDRYPVIIVAGEVDTAHRRYAWDKLLRMDPPGV